MSIRRKLVISLILIVIPLTVLGVVTFRVASNSLFDEVDAGLERLAITTAERLDDRLDAIYFELDVLANGAWLGREAAGFVEVDQPPSVEFATGLIQAVELHHELQSLTLLNLEGAVVAASDPTGVSQGRAITTDVPSASTPLVSATFVDGSQRLFSVSVVVTYNSERVGVLVAEVSLDRLLIEDPFDIVSTNEAITQVFEVQGGVVTELSSPRSGGVSLLVSESVLTESFIVADPLLDHGESLQGVSLLTVYKSLEGADWVTAVTKDEEVAYSGLAGVRRTLVVAFAAVIVVLLLAAVLIAGWLTRRLERVSQVVEALGRGEMGRRVEDDSADELGRISRAFDEMAESVAKRLADEREARSKLEQKAFFDGLTGLPNRDNFQSQLDRALKRSSRDGKRVGVLFLDLNGFKSVNDTLGHAAGDELLRAVALRLSSSMRAFDAVARWGGDEFVVLCESIETDRDAIVVAERLVAEINVPFEIAEDTFPITVSVGISVGDGRSSTGSALLESADTAMYRAKELGRPLFVVDPPGSDVAPVVNARQRVREAMNSGELRVDFQPIVRIDTGRLTGVEALVRWDHPERGLVGAAEVMSAVSGSDLGTRLDDWVLSTSTSMFADWRRKYAAAAEMFLAVNLGAERLSQNGLAGQIRADLRRCGLQPEALCVEIPEAWLNGELTGANSELANVADLGVSLALDGSAHLDEKTLHRARAYSISSVKLDRSLLRSAEFDEGVALHNIVHEARRQGFTVIAEGVESATQLELLRGLRCHMAQGYHFSKPLEVFAIEREISIIESV